MVNLHTLFEDYLPNRRDVLATLAKQMEHKELVNKAVFAMANSLADAEGANLTLVCRKIGQALNEEATPKQQVKLGGRFINFLHINGLVALTQLTDDTYKVYADDDKFYEFICGFARAERKSNITTKPDDWHKPFNKGVPIVKRLSTDDAHHYTIDKMPEVYQALNVLQSTEWTVNSRMIDLMSEGVPGISPVEVSREAFKEAQAALIKFKADADGWKTYRNTKLKNQLCESDYIKSLPEEDAKEKIADEMQYIRKTSSVKAKDKFKRESKEHRELIQQYQHFEDYRSAILLAEEVEDDTLYFQHNCDSRGRLYPLAHKLSPQGSDYQKALLLFKNVKPVEMKWIEMHIANCFGHDKLSFEDRSKWVQDNIDELRFIGRYPNSDETLMIYRKSELAKEKKTKFQAIAACMELIHYEETGQWRIPIGSDATSQGLQFLSAIARDETAAQHVNISKCTYAPVGDVYQHVGNVLKSTTALSTLEHLQVGDKALRKVCKRSSMTFYYGCGGDTMAEHLYTDRGDYGDEILDKMTYAQCAELGPAQYEVIKTAFPRAYAIMQAMQDAFTGYTGSPTVSWTSPTGFRVAQYKPATKRERVLLEFDKRAAVKVVVYSTLDKPSIPQHKLGICANTVHSLDAAMMVKTICKLADEGITDFHALHDNYGCQSSDTDKMKDVARNVFYKLILTDPIQKSMIEATGKYEVPSRGSWNPQDVLKSEYFLC